MKEKIIFSLLSLGLILLGFIGGIIFTIHTQKPSAIILQNGEGLTTISVDFLGQEWNYELNKTGVQSIND